MKPRDRALLAFRIVQAATLAALLWKAAFFCTAAKLYYQMPLRQDFFPAFFEAPSTFAGSYAVAVVGVGLLLIVRRNSARHWISWFTVVVLSVLCLHQGSYNDATFTAAWWTMLWSAWFAGRLGLSDGTLLQRGARLAQAIVAMILLGGAVGKWTAEYWSGQVLYEIYFLDRDFWLFNLLRAKYEPDVLREIATWYSRSVIVIESLCGLALWALPARVAAIVAGLVFAAIAVFSNFYLFSVVLSLIALALIGLLVPTEVESIRRETGPVVAG